MPVYRTLSHESGLKRAIQCLMALYLLQINLFSQNVSFRVSQTGFALDQNRHFVCPDLGPNCLQRLSIDAESGLEQRVVSFIICK